MKRIRLFVLCLLVAFATQALSAQTGKDCEAKARQIATGKREAFLQSCLAQISAPSNVQEVAQQNKRRTCEQNAKNLKLNPGNRPDYIEECMRKNEAAIAARNLQSGHPSPPVAKAQVRSKESEAAVPAKPVKRSSKKNSCLQQAKEKGLQGRERKQFMQDCRQRMNP